MGRFHSLLMHYVRFVACKKPAVVSQHWSLPETLVVAFYCHNVLMKALFLLVTHSSKIGWKERQVSMKEVNLQAHAASQFLASLQEFLNQSS